MSIKTILVTGANGQLGSEIKEQAKRSLHKFVFTDSNQLDITNKAAVTSFFNKYSFDYIINCAAYTAVDLAEEEREKAYAINVLGVQYLAKEAKKQNATLIYISTDFVFNGEKNTPYTEEDIPNPINYYGKTKYLGELAVQKELKNHYIIRTSWLYGKQGNNFVKTMLKLAQKQQEISIVANQYGTPTNAQDLAMFILFLINNKPLFGIYNFSNSSQQKTSWYDFANEIFKNSKITVSLRKNHKKHGVADRPKYSVLALEKTIALPYKLVDWKKSLIKYLN